MVHSTYCHHSSVTCLTWRDNILVTGSWDSTVKVRMCVPYAEILQVSLIGKLKCCVCSIGFIYVSGVVVRTASWRGLQQIRASSRNSKIFRFCYPPSMHYSLQCEFDHDSTVTCLDLDSAAMRVVSGTKDGKLIVLSCHRCCSLFYVLTCNSDINTGAWGLRCPLP